MANENISECTLCEVRLNLPPNEASGLLVIENDALLEAHSWDCALWTILGEGGIQECIALMGHERGANMSEGWQTELLAARLMQLGVRQALATSGGRRHSSNS
jgi:hypothetical protein